MPSKEFLDEQRKKFEDTHNPRECNYCGEEIYPDGNDVIVSHDDVYCGWECLARANMEEYVDYRVVGYCHKTYKELFPPKSDDQEDNPCSMN